MDISRASEAGAGPGPGSTAGWKNQMIQALHHRSSGISAIHQAPTSSSACSTTLDGRVPHGSVSSGKMYSSLSEFDIGRIIGAGSFGRVYIANHKATGTTYVIKCLSKATCIKDGQVRHVIDEKAMLARVSDVGHPFLVNLRGSFQDAQHLYLVLDFVPGGEFFCFLRDYPAKYGCKMKEDHARFYAAQVVLALEHLHSMGIAYRDLKPENLLMNADGYLKLTDFGFAKEVRGSTHTMCGTPDYLAPEVIKSLGHTTAVDWWSLGCVIYEIMYGFPPFYANGEPTRTYEQILARKLAFPRHWSDMAKDLVNGLLQVDPNKRLGYGADNLAALKNHPWFQGLDWKLVIARRYQPPHKPRVGSQDDTSNFDDYSKLAPVVHPFPLTAKQQQLFEAF